MKYAQYFFIAAIGSALTQTTQPVSAWEWWRFIGGAVLAGVIATKALQSNPDASDVPAKVKVINTAKDPVKVEEQT